MKDITNINDRGEFHGYQEAYWSNGDLSYKCFYNNGIEVDYEELYYYSNGKLRVKTFNI